MEPFLKNVREAISDEFRDGMPRPSIYVLTDDPKVTSIFSRGLSDIGQIASWPHRTIHTGGINAGAAHFVERALTKLFGERMRGFDLLFWLPAAIRPRPHTSVLAEWLLLGECRIIYSTFSSFSVFAAARTGNSAQLMRYDAEKCILVRMKNEEYFY